MAEPNRASSASPAFSNTCETLTGSQPGLPVGLEPYINFLGHISPRLGQSACDLLPETQDFFAVIQLALFLLYRGSRPLSCLLLLLCCGTQIVLLDCQNNPSATANQIPLRYSQTCCLSTAPGNQRYTASLQEGS